MKRLLTVLMLVALTGGGAMAGDMTFGVKGGVNLADLSGDDITNNEIKTVFVGGIFFNYAFTDIISLQPEALFAMKGTKSTELENTGINLTYADIPLLLKLSVPTEGKFVPSVFAGPSIGILMSADYERALEETDIKDYLKSADVGLVLGVGFDYLIGAGRLLLDARYTFGFSTIIDDPERFGPEPPGEEVEVKTNGMMFMVGYGHSF